MVYRREIDGLRAMAVLPVILFHAGFHAFSGGFVGVDVFFVISGYLITSIIIAEKQAGSFTLLGFYERRARRILPALFVVMFVCLPFAWPWLMPEDMRSFSLALIAVTGFASNILFWRTSGYFDPDAGLNPLLHTWSLAVEEQYYLFFPVFLMLAWRLGRRWTVTLLVVAASASLAAAQWGSIHTPVAAFYLLPTRCWELLIGSFVAFHFARDQVAQAGPAARQIGSMAGLLLIAWAVFTFDEQTPFPSLYTLAPTVGAALIILFAGRETLVGRILGSRLPVGIGLISYSAYLWHQPLFAFARHRSMDEPAGLVSAALIVATIVLAFLSWKYVETPFRNAHRFSRRRIFSCTAAAGALFVAAGSVGSLSGGFEDRLSTEQRRISEYSEYDYREIYRYHECFIGPENTYRDFSRNCQNTGGKGDSLLLWGDSYAAALSQGLRAFHGNVIQYTASACPPVVETVFPDRPNCLEINEFVISEVARIRPVQIFLHANWHDYAREGALPNLRKTIGRIRKVSPDTRIVLIGTPPKWEPTLPVYAIRKGISLNREQYFLMPGFKSLEKVDKELALLASKQGVIFLSALNNLCIDEKCLAVVGFKNGYELTAWDNAHLTEASSLLLARKLLEENKIYQQDRPQPVGLQAQY
ncbi:MAG TPA: acyltransferase family protein [Gammaproteobacteria bacterium]|nr:acyltransferase family protein [Gammaproteobacteria bacterium]